MNASWNRGAPNKMLEASRRRREYVGHGCDLTILLSGGSDGSSDKGIADSCAKTNSRRPITVLGTRPGLCATSLAGPFLAEVKSFAQPGPIGHALRTTRQLVRHQLDEGSQPLCRCAELRQDVDGDRIFRRTNREKDVLRMDRAARTGLMDRVLDDQFRRGRELHFVDERLRSLRRRRLRDRIA